MVAPEGVVKTWLGNRIIRYGAVGAGVAGIVGGLTAVYSIWPDSLIPISKAQVAIEIAEAQKPVEELKQIIQKLRADQQRNKAVQEKHNEGVKELLGVIVDYQRGATSNAARRLNRPKTRSFLKGE